MSWPKLEQSLERYRELERQMADPAVATDRARYTAVAKEHGALAKMVKPYVEYLKLKDDIAQTEALAAAEADPEMRQYAEEELAAKRADELALRTRLEDLLLVEPGEDFTSLSWKSAPAPAATRRRCSPATFTTCTLTSPATTA
jgi:peptide chain release factor 1